MKKIFLILLALGGVICSATAQNLEQMVAKQIKENAPQQIMARSFYVEVIDLVNCPDTLCISLPITKEGRVKTSKVIYPDFTPTPLIRKLNATYKKIDLANYQLSADTTLSVEIPFYSTYLKTKTASRTSPGVGASSGLKVNGAANIAHTKFIHNQHKGIPNPPTIIQGAYRNNIDRSTVNIYCITFEPMKIAPREESDILKRFAQSGCPVVE